MYNADAVDEPSCWSALWHPANAGRVSMFDEAYVNLHMVTLYTGIEDPYNLDEAGFEVVKEVLRKLRSQFSRAWQSAIGRNDLRKRRWLRKIIH